MKLLNCLACHDITALVVKEERRCNCGQSSGQYLSGGLLAEHSGPSRIIGIENPEYFRSLTETTDKRYVWFPILSELRHHVIYNPNEKKESNEKEESSEKKSPVKKKSPMKRKNQAFQNRQR